ncbi:MAG: VWA domain-containing protein [Microthrixaceae bacterium]
MTAALSWSFLAPHRLWWLVGIAALVVLYVAVQFRRSKYAVRFANLSLLDKVAPHRPGWRRHAVAAVQLAALAGLVVAYAQPMDTERVPKDRATVILAIDTSLSMQATDVAPTRIDSAKRAAVKFVKSLPPRLQLGVLSFSGTASVLVPPSTDREAAIRAIRGMKLDQGTAIGDAVMASLRTIEAVPKTADGRAAPAAIVLLSDGATTVGMKTERAVEPAEAAHVPVFTIAYGTPSGYVEIRDSEGMLHRQSVPVDEAALANLAQGTGGRAFTAASESDLSAVYSKLSDSVGYDVEQREITYKVLAACLAALVAAGIASALWFQRIP